MSERHSQVLGFPRSRRRVAFDCHHPEHVAGDDDQSLEGEVSVQSVKVNENGKFKAAAW